MRLIIYAVAIYIFYILLKRALFSSGTRSRSTGERGGGGGGGGGEKSGGFNAAEETVQDPVCKTFLLKENAPSHTDSRGTHYFCGNDCLEKYKNGG